MAVGIRAAGPPGTAWEHRGMRSSTGPGPGTPAGPPALSAPDSTPGGPPQGGFTAAAGDTAPAAGAPAGHRWAEGGAPRRGGEGPGVAAGGEPRGRWWPVLGA